MSKHNRRLDQIETILTPQQTLILIMKKAFRFRSTEDPSDFRGEDITGPIERMISGVTERARNESSNVQARAVPEALAEVERLNSLWWGCDRLASPWLVKGSDSVELLGFEVTRMLELSTRQDLAKKWWRNLANSPYPLDPDDAAVLAAATDRRVESGEGLRDCGSEWRADGAVAAPDGQPENSPDPSSQNLSPELLSESAGDDERSAKFEEAVRALIGAGTLKGGTLVVIGPTPFEFLDLGTTLIDREWIDRHVVELAEFGARVEQRGFVFRRRAPWPVHAIYRRQGGGLVKVDEDVLEALRDEAGAALRSFGGRTRIIDGRIYLNINDYRAWNARKVTGSLELQEGILVSSWNAWIDQQGGEGVAALAGVKVRKLWTFDRSEFRACSSSGEARMLQQRRAKQIAWCSRHFGQAQSGALDNADQGVRSSSALKELMTQVQHVQEILVKKLEDLSEIRFVIATISHDCFADHLVLPSEDWDKLLELLDIVKNQAEIYNQFITATGIAAPVIDLKEIRLQAEKRGKSIIGWLLNQAERVSFFSN